MTNLINGMYNAMYACGNAGYDAYWSFDLKTQFGVKLPFVCGGLAYGTHLLIDSVRAWQEGRIDRAIDLNALGIAWIVCSVGSATSSIQQIFNRTVDSQTPC